MRKGGIDEKRHELDMRRIDFGETVDTRYVCQRICITRIQKRKNPQDYETLNVDTQAIDLGILKSEQVGVAVVIVGYRFRRLFICYRRRCYCCCTPRNLRARRPRAR